MEQKGEGEMISPEYYTSEELVKKLNISVRFIKKHIGTRRIPGMVRVGHVWRFNREIVDRRLSQGVFLLEEVR